MLYGNVAGVNGKGADTKKKPRSESGALKETTPTRASLVYDGYPYIADT